MLRRFALPLAAMGGLLLLCAGLVGTQARTASAADDWKDVERFFKDHFKSKNPLSDKRKAVAKVGRSGHAKGVKLLLGSLKKQEKHSRKLRKDWEKQETEWKEKTERLEERVEERRKRARERGEDSVSVNEEEADWLGASGREGRMHREKRRLEKLYNKVLEEEDFQAYILRNVGNILNGLEGEEFSKNVRPITSAALSAKDRNRDIYIEALGYIRGEQVTTTLQKFAKGKDVSATMMALESLGRQREANGQKILIEFLEDDRWPVRAAAIKGLSFHKTEASMQALLNQAKKEEGAVRRRCFGAMASMVGEVVKGTIEAWISFWQSNKDEILARWARDPVNGPARDDPPAIAVPSEEAEGTSFYGIKTDSKHIIFVCDVSGSMSQEAMEAAGIADKKAPVDVLKEELLGALRTLSARDEDERGAASFNIVTFSTGVQVYKEGKMVTATKKAKEKAFKWIEENIVADGMTNIFDSLDQAFNIIRSEKKALDKGADTIFFMTDGQPNRGKFHDPAVILKEIKRINRERKISIHCIGVGPAARAGWLQQLAAENNGKFLARE